MNLLAKPHSHLSLDHQLHLYQGRLAALEDVDGAPNSLRHLKSETLTRLKEIRLEMDQQAILATACMPVIRNWKQG